LPETRKNGIIAAVFYGDETEEGTIYVTGCSGYGERENEKILRGV
jgi:hypothetical protein